ncbi:unnamed protein product, partial [Cladocopium goreaui]
MKARTAMYRNGDVTRKRIAFHFVKPGQKSHGKQRCYRTAPRISNFERLGWTRSTDEDFDVYWASVHNVRGLFNPENLSKRLRDGQVVNHFPNHYELTRKDLMARNIKRYRRERERQEQLAVADGMDLNPRKRGQSEPNLASFERVPLEWVPATYSLPNDYALFVEEFRKSPNSTWIAKPTGKAQGRGIFLVSKLNQLKRWSNPGQKEKNQQGQPLPFREPYIISRYISDPLLVGGKKFDMRLYVLVTNYKPLKVFLYRGGFCRFCVEQYSTDVAEIDNIFVHLTNVAIQKQAEDYNEQHGGKWAISDLMLFIESTRGRAASDKLASDMEQIIVHSLKAVQNVIVNDKHSFEMYGFDVLIDKDLRPWLLEVNASPSMTTTTEDDRLLKLRLINDALNIAISEKRGPPEGIDDEFPTVLGDFACIFDEKPKHEKRPPPPPPPR